MFWPFSVYRCIYPKERYIWTQVRILRETDKALLVNNGRKFWIAKSQIGKIRLRKNTFGVYVRESIVG